MTKITIDITSCKECPHFNTQNHHSTDGWDRMEDWVCTKHTENSMRKLDGNSNVLSTTEPGKLIQGGVE